MGHILDTLAICREFYEQNKVLLAAWNAKRVSGEKCYYPPRGSEERRIIDQYERLSALAARAAAGE
jgi:hypothetical protein